MSVRTGFLGLVVALGLASVAVEPFAMWDGDFGESVRGDVGLALNGNMLSKDGKSLSVLETAGVTFDWSRAPRTCATVYVKCARFAYPEGDVARTLAVFRGSFMENGRQLGDHAGVAVDANGRTVGTWTAGAWSGAGQSRGFFPASTGECVFALRYDPSGTGTTLFRRRDGRWRVVYASTALKASREAAGTVENGVLGVTVGGGGTGNNQLATAAGLQIRAVALFDAALGVAELDAYAFPSERGRPCPARVSRDDEPSRVLELPPGPGNPRNSEGDFIKLKDGRILLVYTRYDGTDAGDHAPASLARRESRDGGRTWSTNDVVIVRNEGGGRNVMSVSLLRMSNGEIALFYLRKNSAADCFPVVRFSKDEGETWTAPVTCLPHKGLPGFCVLNNARVIQLADGRILLPIARHALQPNGGVDMMGQIFCLYSDDLGRTWRKTEPEFKAYDAEGKRVKLQEPGVVELKDGRVMMWIRTDRGRELACYSSDRGETWTKPEETDIHCPCAPVTIKRLRNGDLLLVWNDHRGHPELKPLHVYHNGTRSPLTLAVSHDEGRTWTKRKVLESNIYDGGWYCYFAVQEEGGDLLLEYCAMRHLCHSRVTRVPLAWLYGPDQNDDPVTLDGFFVD